MREKGRVFVSTMASGSSSTTDFGFFRIIFKETLETKMLGLPNKFVRLHGETLSSSVFLSLPNGSNWKIGLEKRDNKVWLRQGWPEFVKHYNLGFGHLLYCRYKGNSKFQLSICDLSTCEINYPFIPSHHGDTFQIFDSSDEDDSVHILDTVEGGKESRKPSSSCHKMRTGGNSFSMKTAGGDKSATQRAGKSSSSRVEHKKFLGAEIKTECTNDDDFGTYPLDHAEEAKSEHPQRKSYAKKGKFGKFKSGNRAAVLQPSRKAFRDSEAFKAASKFISRNPFFISTVRHIYNMRLPASFVKRHTEQKPQVARLEVGDKSWHVQFLNCKSGHFLCGGYQKFLKDNSLGRGDVCIYELNDMNHRREVVLKVSIFRRKEER